MGVLWLFFRCLCCVVLPDLNPLLGQIYPLVAQQPHLIYHKASIMAEEAHDTCAEIVFEAKVRE